LGDVIRLPLNRITERDRTRLFRAITASPLDIELVTDRNGHPCALVYRCGWSHPSFRIEKSDGVWTAFELDSGGSQPVADARLPGDLIATLTQLAALKSRPTAS